MSSEFESLSDIVLGRGIKHSEIVSLIHEEVLKEYVARYSKEPKDIKIILDEKTGNARIFFQDKDITPPDFIPIGARIARQVLIQKLEETENKIPRSVQPAIPGGLLRWLSGFLFWIYNGWYLLFISLTFLNLLLNDKYRSGVFEMIEKLGILRGIILGMLLVVPFISVAMAYKAKREKSCFTAGQSYIPV